MAEREKPVQGARKRVGDYNPDIDTGDTLDSIANTDVVIQGVTFDRRNGRTGRYTLSIIAVGDGPDETTLYHTGSPVVAERLLALFGIASAEDLERDFISKGVQPTAPNGTFPVDARFHREKSQNDPTRSYWTVD